MEKEPVDQRIDRKGIRIQIFEKEPVDQKVDRSGEPSATELAGVLIIVLILGAWIIYRGY